MSRTSDLGFRRAGSSATRSMSANPYPRTRVLDDEPTQVDSYVVEEEEEATLLMSRPTPVPPKAPRVALLDAIELRMPRPPAASRDFAITWFGLDPAMNPEPPSERTIIAMSPAGFFGQQPMVSPPAVSLPVGPPVVSPKVAPTSRREVTQPDLKQARALERRSKLAMIALTVVAGAALVGFAIYDHNEAARDEARNTPHVIEEVAGFTSQPTARPIAETK